MGRRWPKQELRERLGSSERQEPQGRLLEQQPVQRWGWLEREEPTSSSLRYRHPKWYRSRSKEQHLKQQRCRPCRCRSKPSHHSRNRWRQEPIRNRKQEPVRIRNRKLGRVLVQSS